MKLISWERKDDEWSDKGLKSKENAERKKNRKIKA